MLGARLGSTENQMISRRDGYRSSAGKEQISIAVLQEFFRDKIGNSGELIVGAEENYRMGDLRFPQGLTIECKGQPIDPERYPQNFVEVFEVTENDRHVGGLSQIAELLDMTIDEIAQTSVRFQGVESKVGNPPRVSVSITSICAAAYTAYVNSTNGGLHIYLYSHNEIVSHLRVAIRKGFVRGAGKSNEDTFAVFVPLAQMRWTKRNDLWSVSGNLPEEAVIPRLVAELL
jgi:hypothetical protein